MTAGRQATARALCLRADNPGPMTLEGTNTWVLREPGQRACVVVDPGPDDAAHLAAVAGHAPVAAVLLTHRHPDHAEGAARFAAMVDAPVRDAADLLPSTGTDVDIELAGLQLRVVATPGHSGDSVSFVLAADDAVLTGDTILGRGTTVVAHPDGRLADYLDSLRRLQSLGPLTLLPGHGPVQDDVQALATAYLAHREQRLAQVQAALDAGAVDAADVVARVYADVDRALWPAAELSVRAQLDYLGR